MNPRERLQRAAEDGERIYRAYMHGDIEDMTAADLNRLSGILTLDLPDALGAYDGLERAYRQACTNLATIRPDLTRDLSLGEQADLYYDALLDGWGGIEGYDPGRKPAPKTYWTCAWCGHENGHDGVMCDECHRYGQPPDSFPARRPSE